MPKWQGKRINAYGILSKHRNHQLLTFDNIVRTIIINEYNTMIINHNGIICHISKVDQPQKIWYHIWIDLESYGDNYIEEKLGVTDPTIQQKLQDEFYRATKSYSQRQPKLLEEHNLRLDKTDYPFYLADRTGNSVTVYMEKGLFTLGENRPGGYPWTVIYEKDMPEQIQTNLYDHRKRFGDAMYKKLHKICDW